MMNGEKELTFDQLIKENRKLKEDRICIVCKNEQANRMFLPCSHLKVCEKCSPALEKCYFCKKRIRGVVSVYFA